jgi:hypothetical protein
MVLYLALAMQIEERYAMDDDGEEEREVKEEEGGNTSPDAPAHSEGPEAPVLLHSSAAFDGSPGHNAAYADDVYEAGSSGAVANSEHPADLPAQGGAFECFGDEPAPEIEAAAEYEGLGGENGDLGEKAIEGLPEGELLSPPQLSQGKSEKLTAHLDSGQAEAAGDGWDGWDDDAGSFA